MSNNENLHRAQNNPRDEFYTLYEDVKNECDRYKEYFVNKSIYCNCDNRESAFFQYFYNNFNELQLKELIATSLPHLVFVVGPNTKNQISFQIVIFLAKSVKNCLRLAI